MTTRLREDARVTRPARQEYQRQWYQERREAALARMRDYQQAHPAEARAGYERYKLRQQQLQTERGGLTLRQSEILERLRREGAIRIPIGSIRDHGLNRVLHLLAARGLARFDRRLDMASSQMINEFSYIAPPAAPYALPDLDGLDAGERPRWDDEE